MIESDLFSPDPKASYDNSADLGRAKLRQLIRQYFVVAVLLIIAGLVYSGIWLFG